MTTAGTPTSPRVVVGVDGSAPAALALEEAAAEAVMRHARLDIVHVWHPPDPFGPLGAVNALAEVVAFRDAATSLLDAIVDGPLARLVHRPEHVQKILVRGHDPGRVLVEVAEGAQLLVVGSRGRGSLAGLLLGSVSQHCAHHARCPVLLVHAPAGDRPHRARTAPAGTGRGR
jgi:nucleotide-binding universal stress UspA family protein